MLDEREIDIEIARLEYTESSYPNYAKLADLYTIKNQMNARAPERDTGYSTAAAPESVVGDYGDSEFLQAVAGADSRAAWELMDKLMDTIHIVKKSMYDSYLERMKAL